MSVNIRATRMSRTGENLRAGETQQMGINPRTEVTCSHMLAFIESRGNDEERSALGNMFRRLSRGKTCGTH